MSQTIQAKAQAALAEIEKVTAVALAEPAGELITLEAADAPTSAEITRRIERAAEAGVVVEDQHVGQLVDEEVLEAPRQSLDEAVRAAASIDGNVKSSVNA